MDFRIFKIKFDSVEGFKQNLINKISKNLTEDKNKFEKSSKKFNRDIRSNLQDKENQDSGETIKEAEASFENPVKGTTSIKTISSVIKFKYYTDEISEGLDFMYTNYYKRNSSAKTQPKFHQTFYLYIASKTEGILFTPTLRPVKVNRLLSEEFKILLNIKQSKEIKFNHDIFEKVLKKILQNDSSNIVESIHHIGASIDDPKMGRCYMSLNVEQKASYQKYIEFKKKFKSFELRKIIFETSITEKVKEENQTKQIKISFIDSIKTPISIQVQISHYFYEKLFSWIGSIFINL